MLLQERSWEALFLWTGKNFKKIQKNTCISGKTYDNMGKAVT